MNGQTPYIIGVGPGDPGFLYPLAKELIDRADIVIGGRRQLAEFAPNAPETAVIDKGLASILALIEQNWCAKRLVVLASGDTGLFSIRAYLQNRLPDVPFKVLPGISSLQCLLAHCNANLNDLKIITMHGAADANLQNTVMMNPLTAVFCGGENTPQSIAAKLTRLGFADLTLTVGENLTYPEERVSRGTPTEIAQGDFSDLSVMLIKNADPASRPWPYLPAGIADEAFTRGDVPMTKSEVRAVITAKLRLTPQSRLLEIGSGTGSVTIEAALAAHEGSVVSLEKNPAAVALCRENLARFGLDNVTLIEGEAPAAIPPDAQFDRVFIGGSGGNLADIVKSLGEKPLRVVISAITLESVGEALAALKDCGFGSIEAVQITAARSRAAGSKHLMMGLNPVTIISGERK